MKIDAAVLERLQELSRLRLPEEEQAAFQADVAPLLEQVGKLFQRKMEGAGGIQEKGSPFAPLNAFREDVIEPFPEARSIAAQAPTGENGYFQVPKTVEQGEES